MATNSQEHIICCRRIVATGDDASRESGKDPRAHNKEYSLLQEMLYPLDVEDFMNNAFRRYAVHIQWNKRNHDDADRLSHRFPNTPILQSLLDDASVSSLIRETSSESIFVWLPKSRTTADFEGTNQPSSTMPPRIHSLEIPDVETALQLHELSGHALYFRASPLLERTLVGTLLRETGLGAGQYDAPGCVPRMTTLGRGEVEVFIGGRTNPSATTSDPAKNLITGWHYDFQENFTIQITGVKRWTLHPGIVKHPLRGCTPHYDTSSAAAMSTMESQVLASRSALPVLRSPTSMLLPNSHEDKDASSLEQEAFVELHPGDVLYFPAGMWHTVETVEPGISINISLMASNYASVTCQALQHLLLQHDEWRQCIQHRDSTSAVDFLQQLLETLPSLIEKEMSTNGLSAQAVLPPVLLTHSINENNSDDDDDSDVEDDVDDSTDKVIAVEEFVAPESGSSTNVGIHWPNLTHVLIQNPLAILLHEEKDIRHCYERFAPYLCDRDFSLPLNIYSKENGNKSTAKSVYVLNIIFAGNESHESVVRVRLRLDPRVVGDIEEHLLLPSSEKLATMTEFSSDDTMRQHVNCLVFYGYLIWKEIR
jgi:Cupin-like domain